nr:MAG TPA: hypothetical protein [Caudoviricetes sp.]
MGALLQRHRSYSIKTLLYDQLRNYQIHCGDYDFQEDGLDGMEKREWSLMTTRRKLLNL